MHLRSVLKDTPAWEALGAALADGGVLAASSAGAMVLSDPMVDPRGGAFTVGLGLVPRVAVVPHVEEWSADRLHRTLDLAENDPQLTVLCLEAASAAIRGPDGRWEASGRVTAYRGRIPGRAGRAARQLSVIVTELTVTGRLGAPAQAAARVIDVQGEDLLQHVEPLGDLAEGDVGALGVEVRPRSARRRRTTGRRRCSGCPTRAITRSPAW